jgi:hypothetical protein
MAKSRETWQLLIGPKSMSRRLKWNAIVSAALATVFVPMLGSMLSAVGYDPPIRGWRSGVWLWAAALLMVPLYLLFAARVKRAMTAYLLAVAALVPSTLAILDGALRLSFGLLGQGSAIVIAASCFLGLGTVPFAVQGRRRWYQEALRRGHLKHSLDQVNATWDSGNDNLQAEDQDWVSRPGCLLRLLPWVGPAIGMSLDEVFGPAGSDRIIVYIALALGYGLTYVLVAGAGLQFLEFRRMEAELGRPIMLVEQTQRGQAGAVRS